MIELLLIVEEQFLNCKPNIFNNLNFSSYLYFKTVMTNNNGKQNMKNYNARSIFELSQEVSFL